MSRTVLAERVTGHRALIGTEFPVYDQVAREVLPGRRPTWIVTRGLCNGVPTTAIEFLSRRGAIRYFERQIGGSGARLAEYRVQRVATQRLESDADHEAP